MIYFRVHSTFEVDSEVEYKEVPLPLTYWFVSSFILSVPLILEFGLDTIVSFVYPIYYHSILEHRFGRGLLLTSLGLPAVFLFGIYFNGMFNMLR